MEKKRKYILLVCAAVVALALALRNWGGGELNVPSPSGGGSIRLSVCDGETVIWQLVFEGEDMRALRNRLAGVKASDVENWAPDDDPWPVYGIEISGTEEDYEAAWLDGIWVDNRGRTLKTDLDFPALWEQYAVDTHVREGIWTMTCRRELALRNGAWDTRFLIAAHEPDLPEDVTMSFTDEDLSWAILNEGANRYSHGNGGGAALEVFVDGAWYHVPQTSGNHYGVTAEEYFLEPGKRYDSCFSMGPYGDLPAGNYRITFSMGRLDQAGREEGYTCALYFLVQEDGTYAQESP